MRCTGLSYALWLLVVSILIAGSLVSGSSVNRTIDDVHGDSATGALPQYLPEVPASEGPLWFNQTSCAGCADVPDASLAFDNTWTAALYLADIGSMSITMKFSGTAIYVYFIVPNFAKDSGLASVVRCGFFIDGAPVGSFTHNSDGSTKFTYNTLVYSNTTVPNGEHVLLIESTGTDPLIVIFDHAVYTVDIPDTPASSLPLSSSPTIMSSPTNVAAAGDSDMPSANIQSSSSSTIQTAVAPVFPSAPEAPTSTTAITSSALPFLVTSLQPDATPSQSTAPPPLSPVTAPTNTETAQRTTPVVAIVAAIAGGVVLVILALLFLMLYRRRRHHLRTGTGTISVFDLLGNNPPSPSPARRRPLPTPPMLEHQAGRSIDATQTKAQTPFTGNTGFHSSQSSVSGYSESRSDLHIHIPMAPFQNLDRSHSPLSSHGHSPITRNGAPMPPDQEEIVRELLLGSLAVDSASVRRGSQGSVGYTTSTETGHGDEDHWGGPVIHVDSGIRISRAMMELPPVYAAS